MKQAAWLRGGWEHVLTPRGHGGDGAGRGEGRRKVSRAGAWVVLDLGGVSGRAWLGYAPLPDVNVHKLGFFTRMNGRRSWNNPANSDRRAEKQLEAISAESGNITKLHGAVDPINALTRGQNPFYHLL
jgi:hypothetical protein